MDISKAIEILNNAVLPHCDQSALHAPGECTACDTFPQWQALRVIWGVSFTGHTPKESGAKIPCPSDYIRGIGGAHNWPGNQPSKYTNG
jgi:hypothetical protein